MTKYKFGRTRQLLAATLAIGGTLPWVLPALADGTIATTDIKNTATGTFSDGTTTYNTTSNEVTIKVAEIAGINVTAEDPNNLSPDPGDTLHVDFVITNTGNATTQFFIPNTATLSSTTAFQINGPLQIVAVNGTTLPTAVDVTTAGSTATLLGAQGTLAPAGVTPGSAAGSVTVRVPIKVLNSATAATPALTVALGNTNPANSGSTDPLKPHTDRTANINANDIYTIDADGTVAPNNGVREAMATSKNIAVGARLQAFAAVLKAVTGYTNSNTANDLSDDILTYNLALRIENPLPSPATAGLVTSDLYGTQLNVNTSTATSYVLVADAIPAGLQLAATNPTAPAGWQTVYSTTGLATPALNAQWTTSRPATGIIRVGFVYDTTSGGLSKGTAGVGNTISGFIVPMTPTATFTGGQIANIAQVFGQSQPGTPATGTATQIVYDESGDQTSNNDLFGNDPSTTPIANGGISDGKADPAADGIDSGTGNDASNTGTTNQGVDIGAGTGTKDKGGEDTVYTIAATPLNGPNGQAGATGPTDTNDDYTNKSLVIPAGIAPTTPLKDADTAAVTFTNTVQNTSGGVQAIALLPTPPAVATDLPNNVKVTIDDGNGNTALYTYSQATGFTFVSGTGTSGGVAISATNPVEVSLAAGATGNYTVTVDLVDDVLQFQSFPVTVTAFVDVNDDGSLNQGTPTAEPSNKTIDRLYTNYVKLDKQARILEANGTPVIGPAGSFTINQTDLGAAATPGRMIEYQITYTNIASAGGTGSITLPATNLVITENGAAGTNSWSTTTHDPNYPTPGTGSSASDPGGEITFSLNGTATDILEYKDTIASLPAGSPSGTFTFRRVIK
jgi:hypothetical protein